MDCKVTSRCYSDISSRRPHWNASTLRESEAIYSAIIRGFCNVGKVPGGSLDGEQQHGHMGPNALIFFLGRVDSSQLPMSLMPKASWGLPVTSWGLTKNLTTNNLVSRLKKSICRDLIKPYVCSCFFFKDTSNVLSWRLKKLSYILN